MKKLTALLALIFMLTGCGSGGGDSPPQAALNHSYGFEYDAIGPVGMRVRFYKGADAPPSTLNDVSVLEALFRDVEVCTGMAAFPPFVIFVQPGSLYKYGWQSVYFDGPPLVLLDSGSVYIARHEFIHHLLQMNAGDKDASHTSLLFSSVSAGGCV